MIFGSDFILEEDTEDEEEAGEPDDTAGVSVAGEEDEGDEEPEEDETSDDVDEEEDDEEDDFTLDEDDEDEEDTFDEDDEDEEDDDTDSEPEGDDESLDGEIKDLEDILMDELSEEQKVIRDKELKKLYVNLHSNISNILVKVDRVVKTTENIKTLNYCEDRLIKVKDMISDYLLETYETKSYIQNLSMYYQVLGTLTGIRKLYDSIANSKS